MMYTVQKMLAYLKILCPKVFQKVFVDITFKVYQSHVMRYEITGFGNNAKNGQLNRKSNRFY